MTRLDSNLVELLERSGRQYELRAGSKHIHLVVDGELVMVLPNSKRKTTAARGPANDRARLRRYLRNRKEMDKERSNIEGDAR